MRLLPKMITQSQGWTTHANCAVGIVLCLIGIVTVIVGAGKIAGVLGFLALGFTLCAIGCLREKLEAMK